MKETENAVLSQRMYDFDRQQAANRSQQTEGNSDPIRVVSETLKLSSKYKVMENRLLTANFTHSTYG